MPIWGWFFFAAIVVVAVAGLIVAISAGLSTVARHSSTNSWSSGPRRASVGPKHPPRRLSRQCQCHARRWSPRRVRPQRRESRARRRRGPRLAAQAAGPRGDLFGHPVNDLQKTVARSSVGWRCHEQLKPDDPAVTGRDVLAVMPTGEGRLPTYQVTAPSLTAPLLVISSDRPLQDDQITQLRQ